MEQNATNRKKYQQARSRFRVSISSAVSMTAASLTEGGDTNIAHNVADHEDDRYATSLQSRTTWLSGY